MSNQARFNAVILSAGASLRMGQHKALLKYGNLTFLEKLTQTFAPVVSKIYVVVSPQLYQVLVKNPLFLPKTELIINPRPEQGRTGSVQVGLSQEPQIPTFVHNIDAPGIKRSTIRLMIRHYQEDTTVIPQYQGKSGHPILLSPSVIRLILSQTADKILRDLIYQTQCKFVQTTDRQIVQNINTPEEYSRFIQQISQPNEAKSN